MNVKGSISGVDLFCGAGGLTYGLQQAGIDVRLGIDIDIASRHPIETNTRAKFIQADVSTLDPNVIRNAFGNSEIRLLAGCAPCQPFSTYSRASNSPLQSRHRLGRIENWRLVEKFADLVEAINPELVTMENVPPLAQQEVFEKLLGKLKSYWIDWQIVECQKIGLPQTRKRLVLLASRLGPIKFKKEEVKPKTVRDVIGGLSKISAGEVARKDPLHRSSRLSELNLLRIRASHPGGSWRDWPQELLSPCHKRPSGSTFPSVYGRMEWDTAAPTITTQSFGFGNGRFGHPEQDRAISLREAAMLQGFPEDYSFLPHSEPISFARIGRLIGNAVPVDLATWIGKTLVEHVNASLPDRSPAL
ncbi:MAG: DNA (cytosine-5-)-methyltransferase [Rhodospirillaceae bacterium]|nr:DNA (cytosine-5-)-methyltransferase [Rhodospirillaceae bacterium]